MNKLISTKLHALIDYATGLLLIFAPDLLGFADVGGAAVLVPRLVGAGIILLELTTDFELSLIKLVPVRIHLIVDLIAGLLLTVSPFIFGFFNSQRLNVWLPHVLVGAMIVAVSLLTSEKPSIAVKRK
jgi:hypothetical protein